MKIDYLITDGFAKDFKRLLKKYKTLEEDLEVAKKNAIELFHLNGIDNNSIFPIQGFCSDDMQICKLKKFACKALKGRGVMSGIRIVYSFVPSSSQVEFIEIYFKAEQVNEDKDRIREYLRNK